MTNFRGGRKAIYTAGTRFGHLIMLSRHGNRALFECIGLRSDGEYCGNVIELSINAVTQGGKRDCGHSAAEEALQNQNKGNMLHPLWMHMIARCEDPHHISYKNYGGRGIKVCERWHDFETFCSDMGNRQDGSDTVDRINNDGDYEPSNCRWATPSQQALNRRRPLPSREQFQIDNPQIDNQHLIPPPRKDDDMEL